MMNERYYLRRRLEETLVLLKTGRAHQARYLLEDTIKTLRRRPQSEDQELVQQPEAKSA
jgi:hypothetical protein